MEVDEKERYIVEFLYSGMWLSWSHTSKLHPYKFKSAESAKEQLKEALDPSRVDSYRFDGMRDTKYRLRKVFIFDDIYTDEFQDIVM